MLIICPFQTQFLLVIIITVYNLVSGCGYDIRTQWAILLYLVTLFLLFLNFYLKSYTRPRKGTAAGIKYKEEVNGQSSSSTVAEESQNINGGVRLRKTVDI